MKSPVIEKLKSKVAELKRDGVSDAVIVNMLKEEFQYYILHFIYTSKRYSNFVMYGGSILRIGYDLPRMSEDLDFQCKETPDLVAFEKDIKKYFLDKHGLKINISAKSRAHSDTKIIEVKFDVLKEFKLEVNWTVLKVRIDVNIFPEIGKFATNTVNKSRDELSFTIKTYPLSTLMASKAVAFLKRRDRVIDGKKAVGKPRDVYDMIWYMEKKIVPDLEYLKAKGVEFESFLDFRDAVKLRVSKLDDTVFKGDLAQFFFRPSEFEVWFSNWRSRMVNLLDSYGFYEVGDLSEIRVWEDSSTDNTHLVYKFDVLNEAQNVRFKVALSDYWYIFKDLKIAPGNREKSIESKVLLADGKKLREYDYEYLGLFYSKIKDYLERSNNVVSQLEFKTKLIKAKVDKLNVKKQIFLDKRLLMNVQFEELL